MDKDLKLFCRDQVSCQRDQTSPLYDFVCNVFCGINLKGGDVLIFFLVNSSYMIQGVVF